MTLSDESNHIIHHTIHTLLVSYGAAMRRHCCVVCIHSLSYPVFLRCCAVLHVSSHRCTHICRYIDIYRYKYICSMKTHFVVFVFIIVCVPDIGWLIAHWPLHTRTTLLYRPAGALFIRHSSNVNSYSQPIIAYDLWPSSSRASWCVRFFPDDEWHFVFATIIAISSMIEWIGRWERHVTKRIVAACQLIISSSNGNSEPNHQRAHQLLQPHLYRIIPTDLQRSRLAGLYQCLLAAIVTNVMRTGHVVARVSNNIIATHVQRIMITFAYHCSRWSIITPIS